MDDFFQIINSENDGELIDWLSKDGRNLLLAELCLAEFQARKGGKRKTYDTNIFEVNVIENLCRLRDELWDYEYKPSRSTAHVIFKPVQREIFAAPYRDRVVQHWVVNSIDPWWDHRLIEDSYSCRVGKGTLYGVKRLQHHILSASENLAIPVYIIKMDITGYFMHIKRPLMYNRVMWGLDQQFPLEQRGKRYRMLKHAIKEMIFDDPVRDVKIQGSYEDWRGLPANKSLFCQPPNQGMVIGNLTSQEFSNFYLDMLDRFVTIELGWKHYGRYVDDFYGVFRKDELLQAKRDMGAIEAFLNGLGLEMNWKKVRIIPWWQGVPFLGIVVKGHARLPDKRIVTNFNRAAYKLVGGCGKLESVASYLGLLKHMNGEKVTERIFVRVGWEYNW